MAELTERRRAAIDLCQQLSSLLSAYRLYPGDPTQPGFASAVDRVREAARQALSLDAARLEIRSGELHLAGEPLVPGDVDAPHVRRLAVACFERRVEALALRSVPKADELLEVARVLSAVPSEVADAGGVQTLLDGAGVWAVYAGELHLAPAEHERVAATLDLDDRDLWDLLPDPGAAAAELVAGGGDADAPAAAAEVLRRLEELYDGLEPAVAARTGTLAKMREAVDLLPEAVRRELFAGIVRRFERSGFASTYLNYVSDPDLVADLVLVADDRGVADAERIAGHIVEATGRPHGLLPLLRTELSYRAPQGDGTGSDAETGEGVRVRLPEGEVGFLGEEVAADREALVQLYPRDADDQRVLVRAAFRDYVRNEARADRLTQVMSRWTDAARQAFSDNDHARLAELESLLDVPGFGSDGGGPGGAGTTSGDTATVLVHARRGVVTPEAVARLLDPADTDPLLDLLEPYGAGALDVVLDLLAAEEDRTRRAALVGLADDLARRVDRAAAGPGGGYAADLAVPAPAHDALVARLDDPRWYVVRNVVTILGRLASPRSSDALERMLRHRAEQVRREAVRSLVMCEGADAVEVVRGAARDPDGSVRRTAIGALSGITSNESAAALAQLVAEAADPADAQRALDALVTHPSPRCGELLEDLASRSGSYRLNWGMRRAARAAGNSRRERAR